MKKNIRLYSKTLLTVPIVVATLSGGLVHAEGLETPGLTNNLTATTENMEIVVEKTESQKIVSSVESITSPSTSDSTASGIIDKNSSISSSEIINAVSETENAAASASTSSTLGTANSLTNNQTMNEVTKTVSETENTAASASTSSTLGTANSLTNNQTTNEVTKTVSETENVTVSAFATSTLQTASSSTTNPTSKQDIVSIQQREQMLVVKYNLPISSKEVIKFAVWSDKHSQDDIIWYSANQTGAAYVELKKHKDYGLYHIHTYSDRAGRSIGVDAKSIVVQPPKPVTAKAIMKTASRFEVTITYVPSHISSVSVPIWSENKGQDDIIWYTAQKRTDGSYGLLVDTQKHKTDTGTYHIHVYGQNSQTGKLDGLSATTLTVPAPKPPKPVTAKAIMKTASRFEVTITDVPSHISSVSVPIWSENKGQDDIIWYTAQKRTDGSYGLLVDTQKHKTDTGTYHIHVYGQNSQTGKLDGLSATTLTVPAPKPPKPVTAKASMKTASRFEVTITDVPSHISSVSVPVWSENKGQDDIIWYTAQKRTDGSYGLLVDTQKHKTDTGTYHIHVYGQNSQSNRPITRYIEKGSKVLSTLEPFSIYKLS